MNASNMRTMLRLLGIGWYVAVCIAGGAFGGLWLDRRFDSDPALTLLGLALGITTAIFGMFRMLMAVLRAAPGSNDEGSQ